MSVRNAIFLDKPKCIYWQTLGHSSISFSFEQENSKQPLFLDVEITRRTGKSVTSVYCKPTFSGVHTHFERISPT